MFGAEEATISTPNQRLEDAKRALSGWLYTAHTASEPTHLTTFHDAVKARTAADFGVANKKGISLSYAANLYDVYLQIDLDA